MPKRSLPHYTQLVAHRGNSGPAPENTRVAIEQAIQLGVDIIEIDVHVSKEGIPVIIHHENLRHTTNGQGLVQDLTLAELKQLDVGSWKGPQFAGERILTLCEALDLARGRVGINIDIKTDRSILPAIQAVRQLGMMNDVVFTGCYAQGVKTLREIDSRLMVLLNHDPDLLQLAISGRTALFTTGFLAQARQTGADGINPHFKTLHPALVDQAHSLGLSVWTWTVDDQEQFEALTRIGVNSITSNWPERMQKFLKRKQ